MIRRRTRPRALATAVAVLSTALLVGPGSAFAAQEAPETSAVTPPSPKGKAPAIKGKVCRSATGVTVVVDFRSLRGPTGKRMNVIKLGCARGHQDSGLSALVDAGFEVDPGSSFVCTIDDRPLDRPTCPAPDGFWSYSHGARAGEWEVSDTGAGQWAPPPGSLEGWSWQPYDKPRWAVPRLDPAELFPPGGVVRVADPRR